MKSLNHYKIIIKIYKIIIEKKENDYLNNNSEDEYERPIVIRNINGLGHNNNQILNGMNNDKNAAQFDVSSQSLLDVETIEEVIY